MKVVPECGPFLMPSERAGREFVRRGMRGEVIMLNLLRFREIADYSVTLELAPEGSVDAAN